MFSSTEIRTKKLLPPIRRLFLYPITLSTLKANIFSICAFIIILICFIIAVQIYLIYFGGSLFRTYGLTAKEFALVLILAFTVIPIDWIRKIYLRKRHLNTGV